MGVGYRNAVNCLINTINRLEQSRKTVPSLLRYMVLSVTPSQPAQLQYLQVTHLLPVTHAIRNK